MGKTNEQVEYSRRTSAQGMMSVLVPADIVLSAGFGTTAAVTFTGDANDRRGVVTITCGGTGQGANPTATLTFKDGPWEAAPTCVSSRLNATQPTIQMQGNCTTTACVFTFRGTASGSEVYTFSYQIDG